MVQEYEDNIIRPPFKFRDKLPTIIEEKETPIPANRTKTFDINPIPEQRTIMKETNKALKGFTTSYEISIKANKDPLIQLQNTRKAIEIHIEKVLNKTKGLKLIETLKITFEKTTTNKQPFPIYISKENNGDCMNLLLITEETKKHYVLIKDFNKFMFNQMKHKERKHFCMYCLQCFSSEQVLTNHKEICIQINGKQAVKMPEKGSKVKFTNFHNQLPVLFVINADFEALTEKIQACKPNNDKSYTEAYQKHTNCSFGYKIICCYDDKYSKTVQFIEVKMLHTNS